MCQVLTGTGGVGKSQIALEYVYINGFEYDVVWWIEAEDPNVIIDGYRDFAYKMGFIEENVEDTGIILSSINSWTSKHENWLFVFDNADNEKLIYDYLPTNPKGHIIITSRNINWQEVGEVLAVDVFNETEAIEYVKKRTKLQVDSGIDGLVLDLGLLPLALEQASSYIRKNEISYDGYRELFNEYKILIFAENTSLKYNNTVATTWKISIDKINDESSRQLLNILAFLYADSIDINFFTSLSEYLVSPLSEKVGDRLGFNEIIYNLKEYSLIKCSSNTISIHRLLQEVIQTDIDTHKWVSFLVNLVYEHIDFDRANPKTWMHYKESINQIYAIANHGKFHKTDMDKVATLFNELGIFYNVAINDFKQAESMIDESIKIKEDMFGTYAKETIITKNELAWLYKNQARYRESEMLYLKLIPECENLIPATTKLLLSLKDNLGAVYEAVGKLEEARKIYEEVINETFGDEQAKTESLANYAILLTVMGEYEQAEKILLKSREIMMNSIGTQNQKYRNILDSLGEIYTKVCKYDLAEKYFQESLQISKNIYEPNYPNIASALNNLAFLYIPSCRFEEAEKLLLESLHIYEEIISVDPSQISATYSNLGVVLFEQEKFQFSEEMLLKALNLRKKYLDENHIDISESYNNLGSLYVRMQRYDLAEPFFKDALDIIKNKLGIKHKDTISSINNLGLVYYRQKKFGKAEPLLVQAVDLTKEIFGDEHKDTIESYYALSMLYFSTNRADKGIGLLLKALQLSKKVLGANHKTTIEIQNSYRRAIRNNRR